MVHWEITVLSIVLESFSCHFSCHLYKNPTLCCDSWPAYPFQNIQLIIFVNWSEKESRHAWRGEKLCFAGGLYHCIFFFKAHFPFFCSHTGPVNSPLTLWFLIASSSHCWPEEGVNNKHAVLLQLLCFTCAGGT